MAVSLLRTKGLCEVGGTSRQAGEVWDWLENWLSPEAWPGGEQGPCAGLRTAWEVTGHCVHLSVLGASARTNIYKCACGKA